MAVNTHCPLDWSGKTKKTILVATLLAISTIDHFYRVPKTSTGTRTSTGSIAIQNKRSSQNQCHLHCPSTPNVVWYSYGDQAGFDDRRQVVFTLANLATSLCARLAVLPPYRLLDADRHFTTVSPALQWNDLLQITPSTLWELRRPDTEFRSRTYHNYQRWTTRVPQNLWSDYWNLKVNHNNNNGTFPFLWEIKVSWHMVKTNYWPISNISTTENFDTTNHDGDSAYNNVPSVYINATLEPTNGCLFIDPWGIPAPMQQIVNALWKDITNRMTGTTIVGLLHIRRGDSIERCDTSLIKIQRYLNCSLASLSFDNLRSVLLLVATDETDIHYRQGIAEIVVQDMSLEWLDLDDLVGHYRNMMKNHLPVVLDTNYFTYAVESVLKRDYVDFVLEQRQSLFCHNCTNLSQMVLPSRGKKDV